MRSGFRRIAPAVCAAAFAATAASAEQAPAPGHTMINADKIVWGPAPPGLPAGYRIAPHWHPTDEHLTILSGTLAMGMGETFDDKALMELGPGGFAGMAPNTRHFLKTRTPVVMQVHGTGPFSITYVNPADDPRNAAPAK